VETTFGVSSFISCFIFFCSNLFYFSYKAIH
jgi:hypothetical protein